MSSAVDMCNRATEHLFLYWGSHT